MTVDAEKTVNALNAMPEIETVKVWTKVAGKESIYIDVIRTDRDGKRYGGSGGSFRLDLNSGAISFGTNGYNRSPYFNSFTKDFHTDNETVAKIKGAIIQE